MKYILPFLFLLSVRLLAVNTLPVTYDTTTKTVSPSNLVFIRPQTATVPVNPNDLGNKTYIDSVVSVGGTNKIDTLNGVSSNLQSASLSSLYPNSVVTRSYDDYVGSTNLNNWMAIQTWGDSLTQGSGATVSSNQYPAQLAAYSGFRVANGGVPSETSTQILTRQTAGSNTWSQPTIIWAGRNDYPFPTTVKANIAQMVTNLWSQGNTNRYMVMSILNGQYAGEQRGGIGYAVITNLNAELSAIYGKNYVDVRSYLVSRYDPLVAQDVIDYADDIPPSSLRSDAIHLNDAGYAAVASYLLTNSLPATRGTWGPTVRPSGVAATSYGPGQALNTQHCQVMLSLGNSTLK